MNRNLLSNLATAVMVICALAVTGLLVRREFFAPPGRAGQPDMRPRRVDDWEALLAAGQWMGRRDAPVRIVEFSDFQCPFCARAQPALDAVRRRHPDRVAVLYRHFPLDAIHPHARPAAVASECAAAQGRFEQFANLLFARQDSLGVTPWARFAREAGVRDSAAFERCLADPRTMEAVDRDVRAAQETEVQVTPTLIVNGTLRPGALTEAELEELVADPGTR
ncbi:MAG TPA: thioredoxin domain-containing protein [Longimicrobium sp.]